MSNMEKMVYKLNLENIKMRITKNIIYLACPDGDKIEFNFKTHESIYRKHKPFDDVCISKFQWIEYNEIGLRYGAGLNTWVNRRGYDYDIFIKNEKGDR